MIELSVDTNSIAVRTHLPKERPRGSRFMRTGSSAGQAIVEFALVMPLLLLIGLGVIELSFVLHDQHVVTRMTREGSNLISRGVTLLEAGTAMRKMANAPVDFNTANSRLIFSVLTRLSASGQANNGFVILYQRCEIGGLSASSRLRTQGAVNPASWSSPDYYAPSPGTNTDLRITNLPSSLVINSGQFVYITEVFSSHPQITPFRNLGIELPSTLYSVAYF